ncbi:hypothetical protein [Chitinophaga sp. OAE865]|uniref:hypothetical protein n=1 Tax=Chitinophaga sp. OAE865 TaxID=2817898 RepID=UPI001AE46C8D
MIKIVMQPLKSYVAALVLLVLAMSSCQKETSELTQNRPTDISIEEAKNWLSLGPSGIQPIILQHRNPGTPDWGNAQFFKFQDKSSILKVPLIDYYLPVGYRDILFQKDSNGIILGAIQEIRPGKAYLAAKGRDRDENMRQFVTNEDFTGDIIIFDPFENVPLRGRRFKDGLVTGNLKYKSRALMVDDPIDPPKPKKKPAGVDDDDPAFEIDLPAVEVTAPGSRTPSTPGTDIPFPSEPVLPKPGGPVTPNNPIPIGGGGGSTSTGAGKNSIKEIKTDQITNQCLSEAIRLALDKGLKNEITTTFNNLFSGTDGFDITFKEAALAKSTSAQTETVSRYDIEITLNNITLPNSSKEFITATILHEAVHAMYDAKGVSTGANRLSFSEYVQHNLMADRYVKEIASALRAIFPTLPEDDSKALAWEGLQDGASWKAMKPAEANKLLLLGDEYDQSHKKGTRCSK